MGEYTSYRGAIGVAGKALEAGAVRRSLTHWEWDISGKCHVPVDREIFARPNVQLSPKTEGLPRETRRALAALGLVPDVPVQGSYVYVPGDASPIWVTLTVRCRRCEWCLKQRAILWANKAREEIRMAPRTWFATFTGNPDEQYRWLCKARLLCSNDHSFEARSQDEQFGLLCRAAGADITRYVKRVRKVTGAPMRYLWVAERHSSGLPHWHALFHEVRQDMPIRKAVLKGQWPYGFSKFKLVENQGAAWYLCKYLSKEIATRVRGSLRYGDSHAIYIHNAKEFLRVENMTPKNLTPNLLEA